MTSNKSIVKKFFNIKATDAKKVICNLCSNELLREGCDEKVFSFDFNMRSSLFEKKRVQFVNGFDFLSVVYTFFSFD